MLKTNLHLYKTPLAKNASVEKLANSPVLGTGVARLVGSSPTRCTSSKINMNKKLEKKISGFGGRVSLGNLSRLPKKSEKIRLQRCVQYVCSDANTSNNSISRVRFIWNDTSLRILGRPIHRCSSVDYYCYSSLIIHLHIYIHRWIVLHTTANIMCAIANIANNWRPSTIINSNRRNIGGQGQ